MSLGRIFQPRIDPSQSSDDAASKNMTMEDYKAIHRRTTELGSFTGFGLGGLLTYGVAKVVKPPPSRNILFLTFFSSATILSMMSTHYLLSDSVNTIRQAQKAGPHRSDVEHGGIFDDAAAAAARDKFSRAQEDPELSSWKESHKATHGMEGGVAGLEHLEDRYATTRGDH